MSQIDDLKALFKTGDKVTEENMSTLIDACHNYVSDVTTIDTAVAGIQMSYMSCGKIYELWFSGISTAGFTLGGHDAKTLLVTAEQFPELTAYKGAAMTQLLSMATVSGETQPICYIEISAEGIYAYTIGSTTPIEVPAEVAFHYKENLTLDV